MSIELKQAAQQALDAFDAFGEDDNFESLFALSQKMEALRTVIQQAEAKTDEPVAWGWAIVDNKGLERRTRARLQDFFGSTQEAKPFSLEDVAREDREFAGCAPHRVITLFTHPATDEPVQADSSGHLRVIASLDAECNSLAHQLNASNERNGMLRVALSDCSAELFAQCGDQSRAMSYVNAARAALAQAQEVDERDWWTDADADAARLALELECLLLDTKDTAAVSRWWASANEALDLHRARLAAPQQATPEPVVEPRARVELIKTGGNAGLSTRIIELDIATRERLRPGDLLYTHPAPGVPDGVVRDAISTVREQYRGTDLGKAAECICDAIDDAMIASPAQKGGE